MKETFLFWIILMACVACKSHMVKREGLYGEFEAVVNNGRLLPSTFYKLTLNADGTFLLGIRVHLGNSGCRGKWKVVDDKVVLECAKETDPLALLIGGNVEQVQELRVISRRKLEYNCVVLKRRD